MKSHKKTEYEEAAQYLEGFADALNNERLREASQMLQQASYHICGGGYFGCRGGENCASDHK